MHGEARAYEQTVKVKKEKNNGQSSQDTMDLSAADMDCQFRLDMEAAMRESEQLAVLAEHEYANRIDMLNKQLKRLRPGAQALCVEDVGGQYRQGDCLFQAIRMQYLERSQQLPGVLKRHNYLESVKTFRHAIMKWVKDKLDRLQPLFHELKGRHSLY